MFLLRWLVTGIFFQNLTGWETDLKKDYNRVIWRMTIVRYYGIGGSSERFAKYFFMDVEEEWYIHDEIEEVYVAIFAQSFSYLKL